MSEGVKGPSHIVRQSTQHFLNASRHNKFNKSRNQRRIFYIMGLSTTEQQIIDAIDTNAANQQWRDWKWQMKHTVKDLETFEAVLGIQLNDQQRRDFTNTVEKIPDVGNPLLLVAD